MQLLSHLIVWTVVSETALAWLHATRASLVLGAGSLGVLQQAHLHSTLRRRFTLRLMVTHDPASGCAVAGSLAQEIAVFLRAPSGRGVLPVRDQLCVGLFVPPRAGLLRRRSMLLVRIAWAFRPNCILLWLWRMLRARVREVLLPILKDRLYVHALRRVHSGLFFGQLEGQGLALDFVARVTALLADRVGLPLVVVLIGVWPQALWLHNLMIHHHFFGASGVLEGTQAGGATVLFCRETRADSGAVSRTRHAQARAQHRRVRGLSWRYR